MFDPFATPPAPCAAATQEPSACPPPAMVPGSFAVTAFGCQMNANEAGWLERALAAQGLVKAPPEAAQVLIMLTCSVRDKPEQKVYSLLGRWQRLHNRDPRVFAAVGGCVAQQVGKGLWSRFPFVRLVFGTDGLNMAPQAVRRLLEQPRLRLSLLDFSEEHPERPLLPEQGMQEGRFNDGRAFVGIMQGCDNYCAYCIVPYVRGAQKSRRPEAVLEECRKLAQCGVRELTLLGQNVNSFGLDQGRDTPENMGFARLLREVAAIPGVERVRFTTSHPKDLDADVIRAFGELPQLCPHLHLPLQSGSDRILAAMGRRYDMARYLEIASALRKARPDIALTTDFLVGFPGETEEDFQATLTALRTVGFSGSFSFMYSDRPGVRSETLPDKVPLEVKAERLARLQALQLELSQEFLDQAVGQCCEVLLEGASRTPPSLAASAPDGAQDQESWQGRDGHNRVVNVSGPGPGQSPWQAGQLVRVVIREAKKHSLVGEATGEPW